MSIQEYGEEKKIQKLMIEQEIKSFNELQNMINFAESYLKRKKIRKIYTNITIDYIRPQ